MTQDFSKRQKEAIFRRDDYRCVICGKGNEHGLEIHANHIRPQEYAGYARIENGQTRCAEHRILKDRLVQTESGKTMFTHYLELAENSNNTKLIEFVQEILAVYSKHHINSHIKWKDEESD